MDTDINVIIQKIEGTATRGTDVRQAIADGLRVMNNDVEDKITQYEADIFEIKTNYTTDVNNYANAAKSNIQQTATNAVTSINNTASGIHNDMAGYASSIDSAVNTYTTTVNNYKSRLDVVEHEVNDRDLFMNLTLMSGRDYKLTITNAS